MKTDLVVAARRVDVDAGQDCAYAVQLEHNPDRVGETFYHVPDDLYVTAGGEVL